MTQQRKSPPLMDRLVAAAGDPDGFGAGREASTGTARANAEDLAGMPPARMAAGGAANTASAADLAGMPAADQMPASAGDGAGLDWEAPVLSGTSSAAIDESGNRSSGPALSCEWELKLRLRGATGPN